MTSRAVALTAAAALSCFGLAACGHKASPKPTYQAVCRDIKTGKRVADAKCAAEKSKANASGSYTVVPFAWWWLPLNSSAVSLGGNLGGGLSTLPRSAIGVTGGIPEDGEEDVDPPTKVNSDEGEDEGGDDGDTSSIGGDDDSGSNSSVGSGDDSGSNSSVGSGDDDDDDSGSSSVSEGGDDDG